MWVLSLLWMTQRCDTDWNQAATGRSSRGVLHSDFFFVFASGICGRPLGLTLLCKIFLMLWVSLSLFSKLSPFELGQQFQFLRFSCSVFLHDAFVVFARSCTSGHLVEFKKVPREGGGG